MQVDRVVATVAPVALAEGLVVSYAGDECLIYNLDRHHLHRLNLTAAAIWHALERSRDLAAIAGRDARIRHRRRGREPAPQNLPALTPPRPAVKRPPPTRSRITGSSVPGDNRYTLKHARETPLSTPYLTTGKSVFAS